MSINPTDMQMESETGYTCPNAVTRVNSPQTTSTYGAAPASPQTGGTGKTTPMTRAWPTTHTSPAKPADMKTKPAASSPSRP